MSLEREIGNKTVDVTCPKCGQSFRARAIDLLKKDAVTVCPHCGLHLVQESGGLEKLEQAVRDLKRTVEQVNRKLRR